MLWAEPIGVEPPFFKAALRAQLILGLFVLLIGLALWRRRAWARTASLFLLRAAACGTVGWSIYGAFEISSMAPIGLLPTVMIFLVTAFWLNTFTRAISYLNQGAVISELEHGVQ